VTSSGAAAFAAVSSAAASRAASAAASAKAAASSATSGLLNQSEASRPDDEDRIHAFATEALASIKALFMALQIVPMFSKALISTPNAISTNEALSNDVCVVEVKVLLEQSRQLAGDIENASNFAYNGHKYPFDVITREPLYVYLFSVYDDKMHMMYPYDGIKSNLLHGKLTLPDGIWWQADIMSDAAESKDTLMAVFTKVKITFGSSMTRDEIYRQISSVPINARRVVYHNFVIKRRT
jgi:hypothetical protein